jgi:hypothetical protein
MAKRKHTTLVKHFSAMQLILSMQGADGSLPNIALVRDNAVAPVVPANPDYDMFKYLQDMLYLVEPVIYDAFHQMLNQPANVAGIQLDFDAVTRGMKFQSAVVQRVTDTAAIPLWGGFPPHPCYWIMREVVSDLLA